MGIRLLEYKKDTGTGAEVLEAPPDGRLWLFKNDESFAASHHNESVAGL